MAQVKKVVDNLSGQPHAHEKAKKEVAQMVMLANSKLDSMEERLRTMFRYKELEG